MAERASAFRRCLEELDVVGICQLWYEAYPHQHQPKNNEQALIVLHHARTRAASIDEAKRCYSHRWLLDRGFKSGLPDKLKPKAEQVYPSTQGAVGFSSNILSGDVARKKHIEAIVSNAVLEAYADGIIDPLKVKARMMEKYRVARRD